jgi:hypothetical protein
MVEQWHNEAMLKGFRNKGSYYGHELAIQAARWGADQELEACCLWVNSVDDDDCFGANLRAARRPKPPSLKERALKALDEALFMADDVPPEGICSDQVDIIRRALETLDD